MESLSISLGLCKFVCAVRNVVPIVTHLAHFRTVLLLSNLTHLI